MIPTRQSRPSTANTMMLVMKPRPVEYTADANLGMGSENEREAWRKNRVIQMKLGAYLTEVHIQQRSATRLLKTEEYRFLQEAMRRSGVPKSVNMLDQLHFYREKTFPGRRFSSDWHFREGHNPHHKHPPLSARPLRSHQRKALLNRPKTSATLYRKNINEDEENTDQHNDGYFKNTQFNSNYEILVDNNGRHVATEYSEQRFDVTRSNQGRMENEYRQGTELPPIKIRDNKENILPLEAFKDSAINLPLDIQTSTPRNTDTDKDCNKNFNQSINKTNKFEQLPSQKNITDIPKQRKESVGSTRIAPVNKNNKVLSRMDSIVDFITPVDIDRDLDDNSLLDMDPFGPPPLTDEELQKDMKNSIVNDYLEKQITQDIDTIHSQGDIIDGKMMDNPDWQETGVDPGMVVAEEEGSVKPQKRLIRQNTKTNFNRIKAEPLMPLRHNITSVLRQERTKYEASQKKVKDYLHTINSRDTLSRHPNGVSREHSAQSRKSASRRDDTRTESRNAKKT